MIELRELKRDDREWLVRYLNNEQLVRYLASRIPQPYSFEDANWWVEVGSKEGAFVRAITFNNAFCGVIGVYTKEAEYAHAAELGYWVAQEYWNQGIASKAVIEFTELVFATTTIQRIYAVVSAPNLASIQVIQKAGYSLEGILRKSVQKQGQLYDEHLFARLRT